MTAAILRFIVLLLTALLVGTMFGIWVHFQPASLSPGAYVEQQQQSIRALNTLMPLFGAVGISLVLALAVVERRQRATWLLLVGAALCLLASGLITRFLNQPINSLVMTWSSDAPPANWTEFRDQWWQWHTLRTFTGVAGLSLLIMATTRRSQAQAAKR